MLRSSANSALRCLLLIEALASLGLMADAMAAKDADCVKAYAQVSGAGTANPKLNLLEQALAKAEQNLGFRPDYRPYTNGVRAFDPAGKSIADLEFLFHGKNILEIDFLSVNEEARGKGLSRAIVAYALKQYPEIEVMQADALTLTNGEVIAKGLARGLSCIEAIRLTPAFRMRASLGFTELSGEDCDKGTFRAARPKP